MSFLAVEMTYISPLTCCVSVVIVAIGASRIYRGLVDHRHRHGEARASWDELQPEAGDGDIV